MIKGQILTESHLFQAPFAFQVKMITIVPVTTKFKAVGNFNDVSNRNLQRVQLIQSCFEVI